MKKLIKYFVKKIPYYRLIYIYINRFFKLNFSASYSNNIIHSFFENDTHIFGGYYDINILNHKNSKILVHRKKINSNDNSLEIGYYNLKDTRDFIKIDKSEAWCWQQGSRLRWIDGKNIISYNCVRNGNYVNIFKNISDGKEKIISKPIYDISKDGLKGLSLNFSRLGRLRPGYGYDLIKDFSDKVNIPNNDGVYLIDIKNNKSKLIVSFEELNDLFPVDKKFNNCSQYFNHLSFNPSGDKFIFFHILSRNKLRKIRTFYYDLSLKKCFLIEKKLTLSHFCWRNDNQLLFTIVDQKKSYYSIYDIKSEKFIKKIKNLNLDGHPTFTKSKNIFISDTYPDSSNFQKIFKHDMNNNETIILGNFYKEYRFQNDLRCDLHPRLSKNSEFATIDSTHKGNRGIYILKI